MDFRYLKTIKKLKEQKELSYSQVPKKLLKELVEDGLVYIKTISQTRKKVIIRDTFDEVYSDKKISIYENATNRNELLSVNLDTKIKKISPMDGLYVAFKCDNINSCLVDNKNLVLFLKKIPNISDDTIVIVVENFENLVYFYKQLYLFEEEKIIFVYRNRYSLHFLANLKNKIIYFGDFDLAGVFIYENEILPKNKNITFFVPNDIDILIKQHGTNKLYKKQLNKYKSFIPTNDRLKKLVETIHYYQKTLEQEFFINQFRQTI